MRQAIMTKCLGPTNYRGARISASASGGRIIVSWDYAENSTRNFMAAAKALAEKMNWRGQWFGGVLPSGDYVFVDGSSIDGATPCFVTEQKPA